MEKVLMRCGHIAQGTTSKGKPCCVICDCYEIAEKQDLSGRKARCSNCGKETDSNYNLAFFKYNADKDYDSYYCGCMGWD